jgi:hypothetical protein
MWVFSATGSQCDYAKNAAKCDVLGARCGYFSDIHDLLAGRSEFEHLIHVVLCEQVTCFYDFAGQSVSHLARKPRASQQ